MPWSRFPHWQATPADFVAIKVDIDHGPEIEIVRSIARTPALASLVDELFFEYHFDFDKVATGWGDPTDPSFVGGQHNVDDALRLMHDLRRVGIRSHFWI